ncbi:MAG TPA: carbamoyl phosphate synthase, partial [Thermomicrobiales bacterium]|nr:carbamoyl phosphate synthase [Thermomicrobiales bacterium]
IRIAAGEPLNIDQKAVEPVGHAMEVRITAEDAAADFAPNIGTIDTYIAPGGPGIRVDSHLYTGYSVPPHYDSLLGKIIAWGATRDEAIARLERAFAETVITGISQTVAFHRRILADEAFRDAQVHTGYIPTFLERHGPDLTEDRLAARIEQGGS